MIEMKSEKKRKEKKRKGYTHILPNMPNLVIHPQPLQKQPPNPLLNPKLINILPFLRCNPPEQSPLFDLPAQQSSSTSKPEEDQVEFSAREQLH
jgi:hypothetical protein